MKTSNKVFIATSLDGFISDKNGGLEWLNSIDNPEHEDMGYNHFMDSIDAIIMGRNTYDTVRNFGIEWPYSKPVFVLSYSLNNIPEDLNGKVEKLRGNLIDILMKIHQKGYYNLYIDGGNVIQQFLKEDLVDELILTKIPILLGGGTPLFSSLPKSLLYELKETKIYLNKIVQMHFMRNR